MNKFTASIVDEGNCFVAGTLVATPAGYRPIEELSIGDLVISAGEKTGEMSVSRITQLHRGESRDICGNQAISVIG